MGSEMCIRDRDISETTITKYQKFDEIRIEFSLDNQTTYITVLK